MAEKVLLPQKNNESLILLTNKNLETNIGIYLSNEGICESMICIGFNSQYFRFFGLATVLTLWNWPQGAAFLNTWKCFPDQGEMREQNYVWLVWQLFPSHRLWTVCDANNICLEEWPFETANVIYLRIDGMYGMMENKICPLILVLLRYIWNIMKDTQIY